MEHSSRRAIERLHAACRAYHRGALRAATAAVLVLALSPAVRAQDVEAFFTENCAACHTIGGGPFIGPDLKDVTKRRDRAWLVEFMLDPEGVVASGDPYASQLVEESGGLIMPHVPGLTPQIAEALLDLIDAKSAYDTSQVIGVQTSDQPFTPQDIEQGRRLFFGEARLSAGGAACFSCHTIQGAEALGGGRLGPDLSQIYERLQGRKPLGAWLSVPPTPTMRAAYGQNALKSEEVQALVAFFEAQGKERGAETWQKSAQFLLFSVSGTVLALLAFGGVWRRRLRAVRRPLVRGAGAGGEAWR